MDGHSREVQEEVKQQLNKARGSQPDIQGVMFPKSLGFISHMHLEKTTKEKNGKGRPFKKVLGG